MKTVAEASIMLDGHKIDYRTVHSKAASKLRVRVGPEGMEVVKPLTRNDEEVKEFLRANSSWIAGQLERVHQLRHLRRAIELKTGEMLFRGEPTEVRIELRPQRRGANRVINDKRGIVIICGRSPTLPATSLENWLRRQARADISKHLASVTRRLNQVPNKVYIMGQRTKWGNCSALRNLSFNWRLIMAPPFVLRYLVTHEAVHLAVPDHSARFWLTLKSHCPEMERAKQWLSANGNRLLQDIKLS